MALDMPAMEDGLAFGFMPEDIIYTLMDIGNWRRRAAAMDSLHHHLRQLTATSRIPPATFPALLHFMHRLIQDSNFKICVSAMGELIHIIQSVPDLARRELLISVPILVERFCDSKVLLRQQAHMVVRAMMDKIGPDPTLTTLAQSSTHFVARAREEVLNVFIYAMLKFPAFPFDWSSVAATLLAAMDDPKDRVRAVALEGMAIVASRIPETRLANLFTGLRCSSEKAAAVAARTQCAPHAHLNGEGFVEHCIDLEQRSGSSSTRGVTPQGRCSRLPFGVPSPGPIVRSSSHLGSARTGVPFIEGQHVVASAAAPRPAGQWPKRSHNPTLSAYSGYVPLSYSDSTCAPEGDESLQSTSTAALMRKLSDKWRTSTEHSPAKFSASLPALGMLRSCEILPPALSSDVGSPEPRQPFFSHAEPACESESLRPRHITDNMAASASHFTPMLFQKCASTHCISPKKDLTALKFRNDSVGAIGTLRRTAMRGSPSTQSAPTSDVPIPTTSGTDAATCFTPSKAARLQSLKQRQAERRAQSAGVIPFPPEPLMGGSMLNGSGGPASMHSLPLLRATSSSTSSSGRSAAESARLVTQPSLPRRALRAAPAPAHKRRDRPSCDATLAAGPSGTHSGSPLSSCSRGPDDGTGPIDVRLEHTTPFTHPDTELTRALADLATANTAKRNELDWVKNQEAISVVRHLLRHHDAQLLTQLRGVLAAMLPCVAALRSSTAKAALLFFRVRRCSH
jgi:hypothetical protein